jgi:hypothetical protein
MFLLQACLGQRPATFCLPATTRPFANGRPRATAAARCNDQVAWTSLAHRRIAQMLKSDAHITGMHASPEKKGAAGEVHVLTAAWRLRHRVVVLTSGQVFLLSFADGSFGMYNKQVTSKGRAYMLLPSHFGVEPVAGAGGVAGERRAQGRGHCRQVVTRGQRHRYLRRRRLRACVEPHGHASISARCSRPASVR